MYEELLRIAIDQARPGLPAEVLELSACVIGSRPCVWVTLADSLGGRPDRAFMLRNLARRLTVTIADALRGGAIQRDFRDPLIRFRFASENGAPGPVAEDRVRALVERRPEVMGGQQVVRGTRIPIDALLRMFRQGTTEAEILAGYPSIDREKATVARAVALAGHP